MTQSAHEKSLLAQMVIVDELKRKISKLVECVNFYADESNWEYTGNGLALCWRDKIKDDYDKENLEFRKPEMIGGRRARDVLKEIEG